MLEGQVRILLDEQDGDARRAQLADDREDLAHHERRQARGSARRGAGGWAAHQPSRDREHLCSPPESVPAIWLADRQAGEPPELSVGVLPDLPVVRARVRAQEQVVETLSLESIRRPSGTCDMPSRTIASARSLVTSRPS
jgi:hypothetical protein